MGSVRILDLSNPNNWENIYNTSRGAVVMQTPNGRKVATPIPPIVAPILLETAILAVTVDTEEPEGKRWRFAGTISQKVSAGFLVGGGVDTTSVSTRPLLLNQINLIIFEKVLSSYAVAVTVPPWFFDATVTIWQYTGVDKQQTDELVKQRFDNVDQKLNNLEALINSK